MPDRSSHQGLPEDWSHGSHAARGPFSADGASNGYGAGKAESHRARTTDGYDTGPIAAYGAPKTDALGARTESYGTGNGEAFGARAADGYAAVRTDAYPAGAYGAAAANPFGDADPFGPRAPDPFGPAPTAAYGAVTAETETAGPGAEPPVTVIGDPSPREASDARGFLSALFDFGFTSFVTPKVIKVLYMLIVAGTVVSALVFTIAVFKASALFGFLMLVFGDPLFILIVLAIYRIILEFFVVTFRVAEDIRVLRERGGLS
jgi:Domain of unknown function (DUF4282)